MVLEIKTIEYQGKIVFEKLIMSTHFKRIPKLFQEDEACFMFLTKGGFQFRTPTNIINFSEGDAMLAKCGNYFIEQVVVPQYTQSDTLEAIGVYFYPNIVKSFFETDLSLKHFQSHFDTTKVSVEPLLKSYLESIQYLIDNPYLADNNLIINKLKELLLLLSKSEKAPSIQAFVASLFVPHEYNFNEIIQKNLYSNLSLDDFAHLCSCSLATFKRKFAELYNESPAKYLLLKKLEKASEMLHIKSKPVADIAYDCGFETVTNFNKAFKKHYKKSPSEYRLS